jgi:hypothetical protein
VNSVVRNLLTAPLVLALAAPASAGVIYVDVDAVGTGDGSSWADAFTDLQDGLAVAVSGDQLWVAAGSYKPTAGSDRQASFQLVNGLSIYGGFDGTETDLVQRDWVANLTVLSGDIGVLGAPVFDDFHNAAGKAKDVAAARELFRRWVTHAKSVMEGAEALTSYEDDSHHVVRGGGTDSTAVLDGFTVTRGYATDDAVPAQWGHSGGGMLIVNGSPTVANVDFVSNSAWGYGGGLATVNGGSPELVNVRFDSCFSVYQAGGLYISGGAPILTDVTFQSNMCDGVGGGVVGGSGAAFSNVSFLGNYSSTAGGGMACGGAATFTNVRFEGNGADQAFPGGGGLLSTGSPTLVDVTFLNNSVTGGAGGGMFSEYGDPTLVNVVFSGNSMDACYFDCENGGGGMANLEGNPTLINVTFAANVAAGPGATGGGFYYRGSGAPTLSNSIFWGNTAALSSPEIYNEGDSLLISYSLIAGSDGSGLPWDSSLGVDGGNNLDADPLFVDLLGGDLQLTVGSPAANTGNTLALPMNLPTDLAGNPRVVGTAVDMGAYEFQTPNCETFAVVMGDSWDGVSLQEVLDAEYGAGLIDAATDYEGYHCGDAVDPYWIDSFMDGWIVREIDGAISDNVFGWYVENLSAPLIDGVDDGVIFDGSAGEGASAAVAFPLGTTRFGFYMNPRGPGDATNAPEPEMFFTNRFYNDAGPDGNGDTRPPTDGDPQCLIYNITDLRGGTSTYVLAWEDVDYGSPITPTFDPDSTDNDFQDLVIEIQAMSPVPVVTADLMAERVSQGVRLRWEIAGAEHLERLELLRRREQGAEKTVASWVGAGIDAFGEWVDVQADQAWQLRYRLEGVVGAARIRSGEIEVNAARPAPTQTRLLAAVPNPFNPSTELRFQLQVGARVELVLYDLAGRSVHTLLDERLPAGEHAVVWDGRDDQGQRVSSGVYLYRLRAGNYVETKRTVLLK